jgi:hypothetical protein
MVQVGEVSSDLQNKSSVIQYAFTATQRAATSQ